MKTINELRSFSFKDTLVKELREHLLDREFMRKLDSNINLIGFENGVYELDISAKPFQKITFL